MHKLQLFALTLTCSLVLAACSTTPTPAPTQPSGPTNTDTHQINNEQGNAVPTQQIDPLNDPHSILAKRSVYFDYDSFVVKPDFSELVNAHASYLQSHQGRKVVLQGNADERGSREYNLALGQKRAEAVRKSLMALGVSDKQMETISFGKEQPKALGHDEAAWAENRRADIVYSDK